MSHEGLTSPAQGGTVGPEAAQATLNLIRNQAERDALIDRVVTLNATQPQPVLEAPVVFDSGALDLTAPHASMGDLSRSINRAPLSGIRGKAIAAGLTGIAVIGGLTIGSASAQDATEAPRTQDPTATFTPEIGTPEPGGSAEPTDPITGGLICPPEESPTPIPTPSPTPVIIAGQPGGEVLAAVRRDDGSTVVVRLAQAEPSASPAASEDPETALACPTPTPAPTEGQEPSATPKPPLENLKKLITGPHKDIPLQTVADEIMARLNSDDYARSAFRMVRQYENQQDLVNECLDAGARDQFQLCTDVWLSSLLMYANTRNPEDYKLVDRWGDSMINNVKGAPEDFEGFLLERLEELKKDFPTPFQSSLSS